MKMFIIGNYLRTTLCVRNLKRYATYQIYKQFQSYKNIVAAPRLACNSATKNVPYCIYFHVFISFIPWI